MSARKDPALKRLAEGDSIKIAACYPRAVRWLFHAADAPLPPDGVEVLNMRVDDADTICAALGGDGTAAWRTAMMCPARCNAGTGQDRS